MKSTGALQRAQWIFFCCFTLLIQSWLCCKFCLTSNDCEMGWALMPVSMANVSLKGNLWSFSCAIVLCRIFYQFFCLLQPAQGHMCLHMCVHVTHYTGGNAARNAAIGQLRWERRCKFRIQTFEKDSAKCFMGKEVPPLFVRCKLLLKDESGHSKATIGTSIAPKKQPQLQS